jgi:kynurenine formamidase
MVEAAVRQDNWGRWGTEDERGALNLLTPEVVLRAGSCIKTGKVYSLGLPISQQGTPVFGYRNPPMRLTQINGHQMGSVYPGAEVMGVAEDYLMMGTHVGTHMDSLVHCWHGDQVYNGYPAEVVNTWHGAQKCGIDKTSAVATRGILLDFPAFFGADYVEPPHIITAAEIEACARAEGVEPAAGDALVIRTGHTWLMRNKPDPTRRAQAGIGLEAARYIKEKDIAVVAADNAAVECIPFENNEFITVHKELIWKLGIPLMEMLDLEELAADRAHEFLFVVAPLKIAGGMGSPINPIAIA